MKTFLLFLHAGGSFLLPIGVLQAENLEKAIEKTGMNPNGKKPPFPICGRHITHRTGTEYLIIELKEINRPEDI